MFFSDGVSVSIDDSQSADPSDTQASEGIEKFVATNEWQKVKKGT